MLTTEMIEARNAMVDRLRTANDAGDDQAFATVEAELRAEFIAEAEAAHQPASQVVRELMRQFVQTQRES